MVRPIKSKQIPDLQNSIKEAAWRQIAESGASSLSLRGIARELKISAPAIYNYFPDRDSLVTTLVNDAYCSFGDHQLAAKELFPGEDQILQRFMATGLAYRKWALTYPQRYLLIFGTPIPGYQLPMDQILPVMMRALGALASIVGELHAAGMLAAEGMPRLNQSGAWFCGLGQSGLSPEEELVYSVSILIWARVHGQVSLEITGMLPSFGDDGDALYLYELTLIVDQFVRKP
jgi:AcrR family transcriptional regulator